ncbi:MAG TPA: hypothetical protein VHX60_04630 [Acidobacteriaceae bacterium]|jgi:hypothetical protein|nr:hypothetical protein [Acidobacteriaceae bacterium]
MKTPEEQARHAATQLLNASMTYARLILRKYGELGPFGYAMDAEGQVFRETVEVPRLPSDPKRLWKLLGDHMAQRVRRGAIQALAMSANVSLREPSAEGYVDAVVVSIEEASGYAVEVTVPYRIYGGHLRNLLPRRIAVGKPVAEDADCHIFSARRASGLS